MKTTKKLIALLLSILMLFTMVSGTGVAVAAEEATEPKAAARPTITIDAYEAEPGDTINATIQVENYGYAEGELWLSVFTTPLANAKRKSVSLGEVPVRGKVTAEFSAEATDLSNVTNENVRTVLEMILGRVFPLVYRLLSIFLPGLDCELVKIGENYAAVVAIASVVEKEAPAEPEEPDEDDYYTVTFDLNYEGALEAEKQKVKAGEYVAIPEVDEREGYAFVGWYTSDKYDEVFNFAEAINSDYVLYARWIYVTDKTDTDNDGLIDVIEDFFATNVTKDDTDGDGLTDYIEIMILALDPNNKDTDGNLVEDGDEDSDSDGLSNKLEAEINSNPTSKDTDGDGLSDQEEIKLGTDPCLEDTDMDGASDKKEVELGSDPLVAQTTFDITATCVDNSDDIRAFVDICLTGNQVDSLSINVVEDADLFPTDMPGYLGKPFEFKVEGSFDEAILKFEFDEAKLNSKSDPTIYYFNEDKQLLEALDTEVEGNVAKASTTHFSKYILLDRTVYEESFSWIDVWDSGKNFSNVEIVLVIDDSGSLGGDYGYSSSTGTFTGGMDPEHKRLEVARTFIDKANTNAKIGIVKFDGVIDNITNGLIECSEEGKEVLKDKLKFTYKNSGDYNISGIFDSRGTTYMYGGIERALSQFSTNVESTLKVVVVFTDGQAHDYSKHNSVINSALANDVKIYTVGLGNSTSYFNDYLKPLATRTGGAFYMASDAKELSSIYDNISQKIDIETDSDGDGIPDYYEDNLVTFAGVDIKLDKNNCDTDNDGYLDGEEVELKYEYNEDKTKVKVTGKIISSPDKKRKFTTVAYDIPKNKVLKDTNMNIKEIHPFLGFTSAMMELSTDASNMLENVPVALDAFGFVCSWIENSVSITQLKVTTSEDNKMSIKYGSSIELGLSGKKTSLSSLLVDRLYSYSPSIVFNSKDKADECIRNWFGLTGSGKYSMQLDFGRVYVGDYGYYLLYEDGDFYQVPIIHEDTTMYVYYKEGKEVKKLFDAAVLLRGLKIKLPESEKAKVLEQLKKNGFEPI